MIRAAIYARFSSDRQKDRSIEDQIGFCRDNAAKHGMAIVATFEDRQLSGAGAINRPGFQTMMKAAEAGQFDVIIGEDLDRLFRSQADYHTSRRTLDFHGVTIHTVANGRIGALDGALRA